MTSNEPSASPGRPPPSTSAPKPHMEEKTLRTDALMIERKIFILSLRENPRGRFLRITEDVRGRRDDIIVPAVGLEDFGRVVAAMAQLAATAPAQPA